MDTHYQGDFTLPGETGYESLTLDLAVRWGADVIRDSDGTKLSPSLQKAGYRVYSTLCVIREHNEFLQTHPQAQQQTFLCSQPVLADGSTVNIPLMTGYFREQFECNDSADAIRYWQVFDRTAQTPVPRRCWSYNGNGTVHVEGCTPWHRYTVSFLCNRIWEEISMYNHTINGWQSEHLRQLDPRNPAAFEYLTHWLVQWCEDHPDTNVVRFTSMFYNFVWIWGEDSRRQNIFSDWASYDFTVSPAALDAFEAEYGYALTAEDFINKGNLQATHMPPTKQKQDYMNFIQSFVADKTKELVQIVHRFGKQAYVFYDDSWVGLEPWGKHFQSIKFDGIIKCVFSGFECRLCAGVPAAVHELRLHPYLFPIGLGNLPTFSPGGHPAKDAMNYWLHIRRALLRQPVERIGLGGYLHLTEGFPDFVDIVEQISDEFRRIKQLHQNSEPYRLPCRVAVLHTWGSLRSWTLSGHFHETDGHTLIHINEALSGLPVDVRFISFTDVENGALQDTDVIINAGRSGDAWSGGEAWKSDTLVAELTRFVYEGGAYIGVGESSAADGYDTFLRMAHVLGVDVDQGAKVCHGKWAFSQEIAPFVVARTALHGLPHAFVSDRGTHVYAANDTAPLLTEHEYGCGRGIWMSGFRWSVDSTAMLLAILMRCAHIEADAPWVSDAPQVETAWFPASRALVLINNSEKPCEAHLFDDRKQHLTVALEAMETKIQYLSEAQRVGYGECR